MFVCDATMSCPEKVATIFLPLLCQVLTHLQSSVNDRQRNYNSNNNNNNNNRFTALCLGLPGRAGTRRNTHPPTILIIFQSLSASSIYHDP